MMEEKKVPLRMCVACREMRDKRLMTRVVRGADGSFQIDEKGKAEGRGAYVCKSGECVKKCRNKKQLNRAFKCDVPKELYEGL